MPDRYARPGHAYTIAPGYLRTAQVARLFQVSPKTVSCWAKEGRLPFRKTLGGHRRYPEAEIRALVESLTQTVGQAAARRGEL